MQTPMVAGSYPLHNGGFSLPTAGMHTAPRLAVTSNAPQKAAAMFAEKPRCYVNNIATPFKAEYEHVVDGPLDLSSASRGVGTDMYSGDAPLDLSVKPKSEKRPQSVHTKDNDVICLGAQDSSSRFPKGHGRGHVMPAQVVQPYAQAQYHSSFSATNVKARSSNIVPKHSTNGSVANGNVQNGFENGTRKVKVSGTSQIPQQANFELSRKAITPSRQVPIKPKAKAASYSSASNVPPGAFSISTHAHAANGGPTYISHDPVGRDYSPMVPRGDATGSSHFTPIAITNSSGQALSILTTSSTTTTTNRTLPARPLPGYPILHPVAPFKAQQSPHAVAAPPVYHNHHYPLTLPGVANHTPVVRVPNDASSNPIRSTTSTAAIATTSVVNGEPLSSAASTSGLQGVRKARLSSSALPLTITIPETLPVSSHSQGLGTTGMPPSVKTPTDPSHPPFLHLVCSLQETPPRRESLPSPQMPVLSPALQPPKTPFSSSSSSKCAPRPVPALGLSGTTPPRSQGNPPVTSPDHQSCSSSVQSMISTVALQSSQVIQRERYFRCGKLNTSSSF